MLVMCCKECCWIEAIHSTWPLHHGHGSQPGAVDEVELAMLDLNLPEEIHVRHGCLDLGQTCAVAQALRCNELQVLECCSWSGAVAQEGILLAVDSRACENTWANSARWLVAGMCSRRCRRTFRCRWLRIAASAYAPALCLHGLNSDHTWSL